MTIQYSSGAWSLFNHETTSLASTVVITYTVSEKGSYWYRNGVNYRAVAALLPTVDVAAPDPDHRRSTGEPRVRSAPVTAFAGKLHCVPAFAVAPSTSFDSVQRGRMLSNPVLATLSTHRCAPE